MQMAPRDDLEREYEQLTPKQKAIVDARVAHLEVPKTHISRDYAPQTYNEEYAESEQDKEDEFNNSYVTQILNGRNNELIPEIVEYLQDIEQNQRSEGTMQTTGDPFSANPNMDDTDQSWQTWDDRPNKEAAQSASEATQAVAEQDNGSDQPIQLRAPVAARIEDDAVHVLFDKQYFQKLLEGQSLPPELHKQLMEDILSERLA